MASLALLFALHAYRPAPFLIMDEVDAALDSVNVAKLAAFVKRRASSLQIVAVSLKDQFYNRRPTLLVGVAKDAQRRPACRSRWTWVRTPRSEGATRAPPPSKLSLLPPRG